MADDDWGEDGGGAMEDDGGDWGDDSGGGGGGKAAGGGGKKAGGDEWEDAEFEEDAGGDMDGAAGGGGGAGDDDEGGGGGGGALGIDVQIANIYYEAEDIRRENPPLALAKFQKLLQLAKQARDSGTQLNEEAKTNHFNSLVHIVCLLFDQHNAGGGGTLDEMLAHYHTLLEFIPTVTRNEAAGAIDRVLNVVSASKDFGFLLQFYKVTSEQLEKMPDSERIRFSVLFKLCKVYLEKEDYDNTQETLNQLLRMCQTNGVDDRKNKGSELLEIYALQIKLSSKRGDSLRMKELYEKTKDLTAAVKDPRSQSVIRECWGVMFGDEGQWQRAYVEFYSAFTYYQEIGNREKAKDCLKYVVVANMLSGGEQNVFDAREAKVYQSESDIAVIGLLRAAYDKCDVDGFTRALEEIERQGDRFIRTHLASMVLDFHRRATLHTIKSYRRLKLDFLAARLKITPQRVESILVQLILDGDVAGRIDGINGVLDLTQRTGGAAKKYAAMNQWAATLKALTSTAQSPQAMAY